MRESCLDCARKHLAQADILMMEYATGDYPTHKWYAVGHMAEASDELMMEHPTVADTVRQARLRYMEDHKQDIDIGELIELVGSFEVDEDTAELMSEAEQVSEGQPQAGDKP